MSEYIESLKANMLKTLFIARAHLGLSREALAEKAGVSGQTIRNMETDGAPTLDSFLRVSEALGCSVSVRRENSAADALPAGVRSLAGKIGELYDAVDGTMASRVLDAELFREAVRNVNGFGISILVHGGRWCAARFSEHADAFGKRLVLCGPKGCGKRKFLNDGFRDDGRSHALLRQYGRILVLDCFDEEALGAVRDAGNDVDILLFTAPPKTVGERVRHILPAQDADREWGNFLRLAEEIPNKRLSAFDGERFLRGDMARRIFVEFRSIGSAGLPSYAMLNRVAGLPSREGIRAYAESMLPEPPRPSRMPDARLVTVGDDWKFSIWHIPASELMALEMRLLRSDGAPEGVRGGFSLKATRTRYACGLDRKEILASGAEGGDLEAALKFLVGSDEGSTTNEIIKLDFENDPEERFLSWGAGREIAFPHERAVMKDIGEAPAVIDLRRLDRVLAAAGARGMAMK